MITSNNTFNFGQPINQTQTSVIGAGGTGNTQNLDINYNIPLNIGSGTQILPMGQMNPTVSTDGSTPNGGNGQGGGWPGDGGNGQGWPGQQNSNCMPPQQYCPPPQQQCPP